MKTYLSLIPIALLLAACGSGGGDETPTAASSGQQSGAAQADSFMSNVNAVSGTSTDGAEPAAVDASPASAPEDTEPSPVS